MQVGPAPNGVRQRLLWVYQQSHSARHTTSAHQGVAAGVQFTPTWAKMAELLFVMMRGLQLRPYEPRQWRLSGSHNAQPLRWSP